MEQPSTTPRDGSINQSFLGMSVNTFLESLSRLLYGTSDETEGSGDGAWISQGEPQGSGFVASSKSAANESKGNQDIAREQEDAPALTATPPAILELLEVYLKRQPPEVRPTLGFFKRVLKHLHSCEEVYLRGGKPRPKNLEMKALANACIALDVGLNPEGFNSFCKELLKVEGSNKRVLADMGQLKELLRIFCETSGQAGQNAEVIVDLPQRI
jgi:hypothetical protein